MHGLLPPLIASFLIESGDTEDITAWQKAAQALGRLGTPAVEPLCQALSHESHQVRSWSAEALGNLGDPRAVEALIAALTDSEYLVRANAAQALGIIGDQRALGPLDTVLATDQVEYVRDQSARALGRFPTQAVFERLLQVLQDPSTQVRRGAIVALVKTGGTQAMPTLVTLLADPEPCIRSAAALGLAKVGDYRVIPQLQKMMNTDHERCGANPVSDNAAYALEQIHARGH
jgi:HEAT repeat protein